MEKNLFDTLNSINVNEKTEKKNDLTYLSWAWAWGELKKADPAANYKVYENENGWNYFTDGKTCWVKVGVSAAINEKDILEHIEYLPIMDTRNRSIPLENVTSFDVNKAIQRALTKAIARHGLGLYIYAGEDLPENAEKEPLNEELLAKAETLAIDLDKLATYLKKTAAEITNEELSEAIKTKEKALAKKETQK